VVIYGTPFLERILRPVVCISTKGKSCNGVDERARVGVEGWPYDRGNGKKEREREREKGRVGPAGRRFWWQTAWAAHAKRGPA